MTLKMIALTTFCATALLTTTSSMAASCSVDRQQMHDQITQYQSVSTTGCPLHTTASFVIPVQYAGIVKVSDSMNYGDTCYARCYYADMGGEAVPCNWQLSNWGDTLSCTQ